MKICNTSYNKKDLVKSIVKGELVAVDDSDFERKHMEDHEKLLEFLSDYENVNWRKIAEIKEGINSTQKVCINNYTQLELLKNEDLLIKTYKQWNSKKKNILLMLENLKEQYFKEIQYAFKENIISTTSIYNPIFKDIELLFYFKDYPQELIFENKKMSWTCSFKNHSPTRFKERDFGIMEDFSFFAYKDTSYCILDKDVEEIRILKQFDFDSLVKKTILTTKDDNKKHIFLQLQK